MEQGMVLQGHIIYDDSTNMQEQFANDDIVLLGGVSHDEYIGNIKTDLFSWLQSQQNSSIEKIRQMEENIHALRDFLVEVQKNMDDIWIYIITDLKTKCLSYVANSWESLKYHFKELCSCICNSCVSLVKANFSMAKDYAQMAIKHIIYFVDILSYIPALNVIAGVILFILYLLERKWGQALLAIIFMIPFLKWFKKIPFLKTIIMKLEGIIKNLISRLKINKSSNVIDITTELKKKQNRTPVSESNISIGKKKVKVVDIEYGKTLKAKNRLGYPQTVMKTGTDGMPEGYRSYSTTDYYIYNSRFIEATAGKQKNPHSIGNKPGAGSIKDTKPIPNSKNHDQGKPLTGTDKNHSKDRITGTGSYETERSSIEGYIKGTGSYGTQSNSSIDGFGSHNSNLLGGGDDANMLGKYDQWGTTIADEWVFKGD